MEKLTNNIHELLKTGTQEIKLFNLAKGDKIILYFSEIHPIKGFPYKNIIIEDKNGNLSSNFRQWDSAYDFKRWKNGIYNLDRLRIITDKKQFSENEKENLAEKIAELKKYQLPKNISKEKALILDNSLFKFGINYSNIKINYQWKAATGDVNLIIPLIEFMLIITYFVEKYKYSVLM